MSGDSTLGPTSADNRMLRTQQSSNYTTCKYTYRSNNRTVRREIRCLLFRDIMSIVTGLRPAVLLDYLVVTTSFEAQMNNLWRGIQILTDRVGYGGLKECCLILVDQNCFMIARIDHVCDSKRLPFPVCVGFGPHGDDGVFKAYWLAGEERDRLIKQIEVLRTSIMTLLTTQTAVDNSLACTPQRAATSSTTRVDAWRQPLDKKDHYTSNDTTNQVDRFSEASSDHSCPVIVDLQSLIMDDQFDLLQMPTVNGWLLGYPLTYHVKSIEHAEKVGRFLSSTTLSWYSVRADLRLKLKDEKPTASLSEKRQIQLTIDHIHRAANSTQLLGFSIPKYLILNKDSEEWWNGEIEKWKNNLIVLANNEHHDQRYWTEPQLFVESRMTGVLL